MAEIKHILKESEFRQNFVGSGFLNPPENKFTRINIFGEISYAEKFSEENLYILYEFILPIGWKIDNENEYYIIYKSENLIEENINKIKSITQISRATVIDSDLVHNFSFPFELELLCHDYILGMSIPKLLIQINSIDSYNRHRIEGYTFINIPVQTGNYEINIPCFKPIEDNFMRVFSYFLGGSRKIPDIREITRTSTKDENNLETALNRYGIQSEFSGNIFIKLNIVLQDKEKIVITRKDRKDKDLKETANLIAQIEHNLNYNNSNNNNFDDQNLYKDLMRTQNFGYINRFSA